MSSHNKKYQVTLNDVVQIVFIILKLCKLIEWNWWIVLIPTWVSLGFLAIQCITLTAKYNVSTRDNEQD